MLVFGLAVALAAPAVARAVAPPPARPSPLEAIRRELDEIRRALAARPDGAAEPDRLREDMASSFRAAQKSIDELKARVDRLQKELDDLRKRQAPPTARIAGFRPAPGATGVIRLVNTYPASVRIIVNDTGYWLAPGETRLLRAQAPASFTYSIPGIREPVERRLAVNETFTIRVFAR
jgi:hypothetical protein